jgi:hypothetical protein
MQDPALDAGLAGLQLAVASGRVRAEVGQDFTAVTDDTVVLDGVGDQWLALPQRPVTAVTAVTVNDVAQDATSWTLSADRLYRRCGWDRGDTDVYGYGPTLVSVTYDHGYAVIPDDVKGVTLMLASDLISNPQGLTAEDIDDYKWRRSESATATTPAATLMAAVVRRYGARSRSVRLVR